MYVIYGEALGAQSLDLDLSTMNSQTGYLIEGDWGATRLARAWLTAGQSTMTATTRS